MIFGYVIDWCKPFAVQLLIQAVDALFLALGGHEIFPKNEFSGLGAMLISPTQANWTFRERQVLLRLIEHMRGRARQI